MIKGGNILIAIMNIALFFTKLDLFLEKVYAAGRHTITVNSIVKKDIIPLFISDFKNWGVSLNKLIKLYIYRLFGKKVGGYPKISTGTLNDEVRTIYIGKIDQITTLTNNIEKIYFSCL